VMSNHYHVVLHIDAEQANHWSDREVAKRWLKLFSGPLIVQSWLAGAALTAGELAIVDQTLEAWRCRLHDLSWFMRCLNEPIARMANQEDRCTGRFWEGRFKSQALLDEQALLSCMAYVDLNPVRAAMAPTPEDSDYTSIQQRIRRADEHTLMAFKHDPATVGEDTRPFLPFALPDYLEFVDWAGRVIRPGKRGAIAAGTPPILLRLKMDDNALIKYLSSKPDVPLRALGSVESLRAMAQSVGLKFLRGMSLGNKKPSHPFLPSRMG